MHEVVSFFVFNEDFHWLTAVQEAGVGLAGTAAFVIGGEKVEWDLLIWQSAC